MYTAFLSLNLLFFEFDTTRFQIFFIFRYSPVFHVFQFCHIITLLTVLISNYWRSKQDTTERIKILKDIDYHFNGFDTSFLKTLIDILFCL